MLRKGNYEFWIIYSVAWLPYAASYAAVFISQARSSFAVAVKDASYNILPAALLGAVVVILCSRFPWHHDKRARFVSTHLILALLYAGLWISIVPLFFTVEGVLRNGLWIYRPFVSYAFQWQFFAGLMIYCTIAGVVYAANAAERLRMEEARRERAEHLHTHAQLDALRAQMNPHFLFNTLHTLMSLVHHNPKAEEALERFSTLLRYTLQSAVGEDSIEGSNDVTLAQEWALVQNYLALEDLRLAPRLRVETEFDPASLNCTLPSLTLQPLVENAIKYAVASRAQGGTIRIFSRIDPEGALYLEVSDDGPGATAETLSNSKGMGNRVMRQRLEARYDGKSEFRISTAPGAGFTVMVRIPQIVQRDLPELEAK